MAIDRLPEGKRRDLILSVGTHQRVRPLKPFEVAEALEEALQLGDLAQIASELRLRDTSTLHRFLRLLRLDECDRTLVDWGNVEGKLSFATAAEIAGAATAEERTRLVADAVENRRSREEVRSILQRQRRSGLPLETCIGEINALRPVMERYHVFIGRLPSTVTHHAQSDTAERRLRTELARLFGAANVSSVTIVGRRFSFALGPGAAPLVARVDSLRSENLEGFVAAIVGGADEQL